MYYLTHKRIIIENSPCAINAIYVINSFCVNNAKRVKSGKISKSQTGVQYNEENFTLMS